MANITFRADGSVLHNGVELGVFNDVNVTAFPLFVNVNGPGIDLDVYPATDVINTPAGLFSGTAAQLQVILQSQSFLGRNTMRLLFALHTAQVNPGNGVNTTENLVNALGFTIPANSIGANGRIIIEGIFSWTGVGSKNIRHKIAATQVFGIAVTTNTSYHYRVQIRNRNNQAVQIIASINSTPGAEDRGANTVAFIAGALNFATDLAFTTTIQHATAGDTSQVEALDVTCIG